VREAIGSASCAALERPLLSLQEPFKGEVGRGMGSEAAEYWIRSSNPIPTLTLPLKGRERIVEVRGLAKACRPEKA
jgi:hypothetical protein